MYKKTLRGKPHHFISVRKDKRNKTFYFSNKDRPAKKEAYALQKKHVLLDFVLITTLCLVLFLLLNLFYSNHAITSNTVYYVNSLVSFDYRVLTIITLAFLIFIALISFFLQYKSKKHKSKSLASTVPKRIRLVVPKSQSKKSTVKK